MRVESNGGSSARLVREIAEDGATLVRKEVQLAKQELLEAVVSKATGAALFAGAAMLSLFALLFAGFGVASALTAVMSAWAAYVVVALGWLAIAGIAVAIGIGAMRKRSTPLLPETTKTIKEDIGWARKQLKR